MFPSLAADQAALFRCHKLGTPIFAGQAKLRGKRGTTGPAPESVGYAALQQNDRFAIWLRCPIK
jgi:hypothetical protein